jgi:hypothetical protein
MTLESRRQGKGSRAKEHENANSHGRPVYTHFCVWGFEEFKEFKNEAPPPVAFQRQPVRVNITSRPVLNTSPGGRAACPPYL